MSALTQFLTKFNVISRAPVSSVFSSSHLYKERMGFHESEWGRPGILHFSR